MKRYLFTVSSVAVMKGRGVMLCPGVLLRDYDILKQGDRIELFAPDGRSFVVKIAGLEYPPATLYNGNPPPIEERRSSILLPPEFTKEDIIIGTEVWTADDRWR